MPRVTLHEESTRREISSRLDGSETRGTMGGFSKRYRSFALLRETAALLNISRRLDVRVRIFRFSTTAIFASRVAALRAVLLQGREGQPVKKGLGGSLDVVNDVVTPAYPTYRCICIRRRCVQHVRQRRRERRMRKCAAERAFHRCPADIW